MNKLTLTIAGDLAPIRDFAPIIEQDPLKIYGDLLPELRKADYRIVNLESPLAGTEFIVKSGAAFTGKPEHLPLLTAVPFEAVTLANNHAFDTGLDGFEQTCALLDSAGIARVGAGKNRTAADKELVIEKNGIRAAVVNFSEGEDMRGASADRPGVAPWEVDAACRRTARLKRSGKFLAVIAIVHCGLEYYPFPPAYVYETFGKLAAAGADLVIGHHVHVPQGMTRFGHVPAFFSLGNFVFYQENDLLHRKTGYFVEAEITRRGVVRAEPVPYRIEKNGLRLLRPKEKTAFDQWFRQISEPLRTAAQARKAWEACLAWYGLKGYCAELEKILDTMRTTPEKGAAMLRNRVQCMQHRMHWTDGLTRIADGTISEADPKLIELVDRCFREKLGK